jgi:dTMP kinase
VLTREPGGTSVGNRLRSIFVEPGLAIGPLAEAFILNASRAQHVDEVIEPALRGGSFVLCDRFADATLAYQGYGRGVELDTLRSLARIATRGLEPDLTLLVDVSVALSQQRVAARTGAGGAGADRMEREHAEFHERVRRGYVRLAQAEPRFVTIDGAQPQEAVLAAASRALESKFGL